MLVSNNVKKFAFGFCALKSSDELPMTQLMIILSLYGVRV